MGQRPKFRTVIGGQALIEGIMMRGPKKQAIVVHAPEGLVTKEEELKLIKERYPVLGWPFIRGVINFFDSLVKGLEAITYSADFYPEDADYQPSKFDVWIESKLGGKNGGKIVMAIAIVVSLALSVGLFILLPTFLAGLVEGYLKTSLALNLFEGAIRIAVFVLYLYFISKIKDIKRVFAYHGAEHKTIHCYEAGLELTVENVRAQKRQHPRCGTSFLFVVVIISILAFSIFSWSSPLMRVVVRLALLPVIVAVSYEINRVVGRHDNWLTRIISAPGLWLQNLTTNEPDDSMIEVGIKALELVIPEEAGADRW